MLEIKDVNYKNIRKLFYNKFPYKVALVIKPPPYDDRLTASQFGEKFRFFYKAKDELYKTMKLYCPQDKKVWRSLNNLSYSYSFFFEHTVDAEAFIQKYSTNIDFVVRPKNQQEIDALKVNKKREIRDTLYWNLYRYMIEFSYQRTLEEEEKLDDTIARLFPKKAKKRSLYLRNKYRRLYLNNENDVLYVYMALSDKIIKQTQVILRKEIKVEHRNGKKIS